MTPALIIFDCDGVLVDSELIACAAVATSLACLGIDVDGSEIARRYSGIRTASMYQDLEERYAVIIPEEVRQEVRSRVLRDFAQQGLRAIRGVEVALGRLAYPFCVASSSDIERIQTSLEITGLRPYFGDRLFSATQVNAGKPAPDLFLYAAQRMNVDGNNCVVIEDSTAGIEAARNAGMIAVGFFGGGHCSPDHSDQLKRHGADITFNDFNELDRVLKDASDLRGAHH